MFTLNTALICLVVFAQSTWCARLMVDPGEAKVAAATARRLSHAVLRLHSFEDDMVAATPVTHHFQNVFSSMRDMQHVSSATVDELEKKVFTRLADMQASFSNHSSRLLLFTGLLNETVATLEEAGEGEEEVIDYEEMSLEILVDKLEEFFSELTDELFKLVMDVEAHIATSEKEICDVLTGVDEAEPSVTVIRRTMTHLDHEYTTGHVRLVEILQDVHIESELMFEQLEILLGKPLVDTVVPLDALKKFVSKKKN